MKEYIKKILLCISPSLIYVFYLYPNDYVIISGCFFFFYILTLNFPIIAYYLQMTPTYFEDLEDDNSDNSNNSNNTIYKRTFINIQQFVSSVAFAVIVDYIFNRMKHSPLSYFEIYGVLAGYFLMYQKISNYFGTTLVFIIYSIKDSLNGKNDEITNNEILIENITDIEIVDNVELQNNNLTIK